MSETDEKYSALKFEYSRLHSRFRTVREAYLQLKDKYEGIKASEMGNKKELRQLLNQVDALSFRNDQYTKRISFLQESLSSNSFEVVSPSQKDLTSYMEASAQQLAAVMEDNDRLNNKIVKLNDEIKKMVSRHNKTVDELKKEVSHRMGSQNGERTRLDPKFETPFTDQTNVVNESHYFQPAPLPVKTVEILFENLTKFLTHIYDSVIGLISNILETLRRSNIPLNIYDFAQSLELVKSGYSKLQKWKSCNPCLRNRLADSSYLLNILGSGINIAACVLNAIVTLEWKIECREIFSLLTFMTDCLKEVETTLEALNICQIGKSKIHETSSVEELLNRLRNYLLDNCSRVNDLIESTSSAEHAENNMELQFSSLIQKNKIPLCDSFVIMITVADYELATLRQYGWWPSYFLSLSIDKTLSYNKLVGLYERYQRNIDKTLQISEDLTFVSRKTVPCPSSIENVKETAQFLIDLKETKDQISILTKKNEELEFELKKRDVIQKESGLPSSTERMMSDIISELRKYSEIRIDYFLQCAQEYSSKVISLTTDNRALDIRYNAMEVEKQVLQNENKRLKASIDNSAEETEKMKKTYESHISDLTEEIARLRKTTQISSTLSPKGRKKIH